MHTDEQEHRAHRWYAIRVRSRAEVSVAAILRAKGYEEFLPLYRTAHRWSDRVKAVDLPIFPGYLFCRLDLAGRLLPVLSTPGVVSFVGAGRTPLPIAEREVAAVQAIVHSGLAALPWPSLAAGEKILIERGPLAGLEGVALRVDGKCRLVVSVPLLQRSVTVEIERRWVRPIRDRRPQGAPPAAGAASGAARQRILAR